MAALFSNDYEISFELRPDYLFVRVGLPANEYNAARQYWTDVVRMVNKRRCVKAAIEVSANAPLPESDAKSLMRDFLKIIYPGIRIAIVNPYVKEEVRLSIETAAEKQGRSMKIVDDLAAAETWLREDRLNFAPAALNSDVQDLTNRSTLH